MAVNGVVDNVGLAALIPLESGILPVENFAPRLEPLELFCHFSPERFRLLHGTLIFPGIIFETRLFFEKCRRMEFGLCVQKLFNSTLRMDGCRHGRDASL